MNKIEKLLDEIKSPSSIYRGAPFWAWNGKLNPEELRWQIRIMKEMGLGGFFMHSRVGLDTEYLSEEWFECINACADEAKKLKMLAYLYDEDRWPSGAAGGLVTKNPKYRMKHLCMQETKNIADIKKTKNFLAAFLAEFDGNVIINYRKIKPQEKIMDLKESEKILIFSIETSKFSDWYNGYTYLDTMNSEAVKQFIKITHEQYRKYCGKYFGSVIPGIFTDEPNYGSQFFDYDWQPPNRIAVSWTEKLPAIFKKRYGYDLVEYLPEIYYDIAGKTISQARYHYHDCITHLFVDAFAKQIGQWCEKNKLLFTGHVLSEDTLSSQTNVVGNCMRFYQYMQAPGMDLLTEHWRLFNTAKQVSSVARQFGRKWRLTETYGCTGWDFPFSGHKALGDWQTALGINLRCQHLSWYTMLGEAKRDYPASIFYQSPWWNIYNKVEDYYARIYAVMTEGQEVRDLLVIHPIESMWCIYRMPEWDEKEKKFVRQKDIIEYDRMFEKFCDTLCASHIDFDYGDEEILSEWAKVKKQGNQAIFKVNKAQYKAILVPPLYTIRSSTLTLLKKFKEAGGKVIFVEKFPQFIDGKPAELNFSEIFELSQNIESAIEKIEKDTRRISIVDQSGKEINQILYLLREDQQAYYLFLCNTSMEWKPILERHTYARERNISFENVMISGIPDWKYPAIEIDPETGKIYSAETIQKENGYAIKTNFPALGSKLYIIPKNEISIKTEKRMKLQEIERTKIEKDLWDILLSEHNVFVLDKPFYKITGGTWQQQKEILKIDREVRKTLGIKPRGGAMVQPWAMKKNEKGPSTLVTLRYVFNIEKIPSGDVAIGIEKPELYSIYINGNQLSSDMVSGWWVDKSLKTIKFSPSILKTGENELILETTYNQQHPGFEIVYILGDFGVNEKLHIVEKVEKLKIGDWTAQGLLFYSGNVSYVHQIQANVDEKQKLFIRIPDYRAVAVRILVDGKQAGIIAWQPNELDITEFVKDGQPHLLSIELLGHRRNSHGPLHFYQKWPAWTGPYQFIAEGQEFCDDYQIVPCGLMKEPEIVRYQII